MFLIVSNKSNELRQNMKYCEEITCVFDSQPQNDVINLIASIDTFLRPSFVKK